MPWGWLRRPKRSLPTCANETNSRLCAWAVVHEHRRVDASRMLWFRTRFQGAGGWARSPGQATHPFQPHAREGGWRKNKTSQEPGCSQALLSHLQVWPNLRDGTSKIRPIEDSFALEATDHDTDVDIE